jgi:hypothetical protein
MSFLTGLVSAVTGGLPTILNRVVDKYLPESVPPEKKAEIQMALEQAAHEHELEMLKVAFQCDAEFNQRIKDMEGTAADLKSIPVLGNIMLFVRGVIRPAFGVGVLFWDWKVLSKAWEPPNQELFLAINVLVLGFYFGERAIQNVMPFLTRWREAGNGR